MSLKIIDNEIHMRRGDTGQFTFDVKTKDEDGEEIIYTLQAGDKLTFTVKTAPSKESPALIQKTISSGNTFIIVPNDTRDLDVGKYSFDIQLERANGEIHTVFPPIGTFEKERNYKNFCLESEVTRRE